MTEVRIRHCRIAARIDPESGFCWMDGVEQHALAGHVQALVLSMLDELLEPHLAGLAPDEVPSAISLDLRLDMNDLVGAAPLARLDLRDRAQTAIAAAIASATASIAASDAAEPDATAAGDLPLPPRPDSEVELLDMLLGWHQDRQLEYRLALLSDAVLARLIEVTLIQITGRAPEAPEMAGRAAASPDEPAPTTEGSVARALRTALQDLIAAAATAAETPGRALLEAAPLARAVAAARRSLVMAVAITAGDNGGGGGAPAPVARDKDDNAAPQQKAPAAEGAGDPIVPSMPGASRPDSPSRALASEIAELGPFPQGRHQLESVLPFLALQRLASHGILDAATALNESDLEAEGLAALAFAVALRAQDMPGEGSRWSAAQMADAAFMAGRATPLEGPELLEAARHCSKICDAVAGAAGGMLIAGHRTGLLLPLLADAGRMMVFESEGLFPLCRQSGPRIAEAFAGRNETFFVADPDPVLLRAIDEAGLPAIASGPPGRGENWRPVVAGHGWRGMTNLPPERFAALAPGLTEIERAARRASEVWHGLTVGRPLAPQVALDGDMLDFDRTAALLAGFALADIAWTLFGRDAASWEEPDPLLAVERFADLSATVEVTPSEVIISLPLGVRFAHLRDAGLLDRIDGVPWWPGRTIAFEGG